MNLSLENLVSEKMQNVFAKLNIDKKYAIVKVSDRPDLSDFQCNGALALAKSERKNPREIASIIADALADDTDLAKVSVDGPGFLNITLSDAFLARNMQDVAKDDKKAFEWFKKAAEQGHVDAQYKDALDEIL